MMNIGEKLRLKRTEKGLNQTELAKLIGVEQKTISNWEKNRSEPNPVAIPKLSQFLGIPIEELTTTPELYKEYNKQKEEDNKIMKLINALHKAGAISSDHINEATTEVIIDTVKKYLEEKEGREV